jgi:hypothetical protein
MSGRGDWSTISPCCAWSRTVQGDDGGSVAPEGAATGKGRAMTMHRIARREPFCHEYLKDLDPRGGGGPRGLSGRTQDLHGRLAADGRP